jgi:flagellar motor switch protein FliM
MSDKILSQDEVDALLGAMEKGQVDLDEHEEQDQGVQTIDLTLKSEVKKRKFTVLDEVFNRYVELLKDSLSIFLQTEIEVEHIATEIVKFEEFIGAYSKPTSFNFFTMDPLVGTAMMVIEPSLVMSLIDCMMGGSGKTFNKMREFTRLENRLIKKFSDKALNKFQESWKTIYPIDILFQKTESNPEYIRNFSPSDIVITIDFVIKGSEFEGHLNFCISYLMLEPVKEELSETYLRGKEQDPKQSSRIQNLIEGAEVDIIVELGKSKKTILELLDLKINDILRLKTGPDDPVIVKVEEVPKYQGDPGILKGSRAVEIVKILR